MNEPSGTDAADRIRDELVRTPRWVFVGTALLLAAGLVVLMWVVGKEA